MSSSSFLRRLLLLPSALLVLTAALAHADLLEARDDSSSTTLQAPLSIPPDQNWDGIDGLWSSFTLRVGTSAQYVRTFLSFVSYQTWVVIPEGCQTAADPSSCATSRGGVFGYNTSNTWDEIGIYDLYIETNLGYYGNALYGYDVVGLGGLGENGPTLKNTTVAGMAVDSFYYGIFGINPKPTNFTSFNEGSPSYMTQLKDRALIPSLSFGYTAGAHYRFSGTYASLTLGGYDTSRYSANNITFNFNTDNDHQIIVGLQSITTPSNITSSPNAVQLLPAGVYAEIDSTVAEIWLPTQACLLFEHEFGLVYDNVTHLYLVNDTLHQSLLQRNPNITFTIGQAIAGGSTVNIVLPYAAFDHTAKPPYRGLASNSNFFPLRRGANSTQYILGRAFLQEAYLTVDYEVARFQLAQATWVQSPQESLVAIPPFNQSQSSSSWTSSTYKPVDGSGVLTQSSSTSSSKSIGAGAIAGIIVAVVVTLLLIALGSFFYIRRNRRRKAEVAAAQAAADEKIGAHDDKDTTGGQETNVIPKAELAGSTPHTFGMTHHDLDRKRMLAAHGLTNAHIPGTPSSVYGGSSTSAHPGEGTYSSHSSSNYAHTPFSPVSEADSRERAIYEMPASMPPVREKDGKELTEKEAHQYRERTYNGINDAVSTSSTSSPTAPREARRVNPEDVVNAETGESIARPRAFSFEMDSSQR